MVTQGGSHFAQPHPTPSLALHTVPSPALPMWNTARSTDAAEVRSLPGVTFSAHFMSAASQSSGRTGLEHELEALSQASALSSRRSVGRSSSRAPVEDRAQGPPEWEPGEAPSSSRAANQIHPMTVPVRSLLCPGAPAPKYPPPSSRAPQGEQSEQERRKTTLQLHTMLYPWWETGSVDVGSGDGAGQPTGVYHERTRVKGKVGLLVDPGAHDNLVGDRTMKLLSSQVKCKPAVRTLERPLSGAGSWQRIAAGGPC